MLLSLNWHAATLPRHCRTGCHPACVLPWPLAWQPGPQVLWGARGHTFSGTQHLWLSVARPGGSELTGVYPCTWQLGAAWQGKVSPEQVCPILIVPLQLQHQHLSEGISVTGPGH